MGDIPAFPRNTWLPLLAAVACFAGCAPRGHSHEKAPQIQSLSNLTLLGTAMMMYVQDYDERFPPMADTKPREGLLEPYGLARSKNLWVIPRWNLRYQANPALGKKTLAQLENPANVVMLYEPTALWRNRQFRNVCFADGHVKVISEAQWPALRGASGIPELPEPKIAPWWRFDVKELREPVRPGELAAILSALGLALCGLAALLRLRYAPTTFWQGVGVVMGYTTGYLAMTMLLGFVLGLIFLF